MFFTYDHTVRSDIFGDAPVAHCFATRLGGVSEIKEVASMNTAVRMGDSPENVARNIELLASFAGLADSPVIYSRQTHSSNILTVSYKDTAADPESREYDGYVTDISGIGLLVRAADCLPILFAGLKYDGSPVVGAAHAGWRGTVSGIAGETVRRMCELGTVLDSVKIAMGPAIKDCCFEVKEDFIESVTSIRGSDFAGRHIKHRGGRYFASLQSMNAEILTDCGISYENIDISPDCTAHMPELYHSHRATGGMRGTGGGIIGITDQQEG